MSGMLFIRAMEMIAPMDDNNKCPRCGRENCTCDPDTCECEPPIEEVILDTHRSRQKELVQDFE